MSGFVRHCVITKECPETFLLFLYKTSLFPRLVQVLRICFLSRLRSLSTSLPLAPFLPRCLLLPLVRSRRHMNNTKGRFIGEIQCKFSVFAGAKEQECLSAENPPGGNIQTRRLWAISGLNQTEDSWKQTRNKAKLSELSRHMLQVAVLGEFPVLWCFHQKQMTVCNTQKMHRGIATCDQRFVISWRLVFICVGDGLVAAWANILDVLFRWRAHFWPPVDFILYLISASFILLGKSIQTHRHIDGENNSATRACCFLPQQINHTFY